MHFSWSIKMTPVASLVIASVGQPCAQGISPHCMQSIGM
jgi:hypothetical protein